VVSTNNKENNLICQDGILYVCGDALNDCNTSVCLPMDNCTKEGNNVCCNGQWADTCPTCQE
jgi:hypothetical protein